MRLGSLMASYVFKEITGTAGDTTHAKHYDKNQSIYQLGGAGSLMPAGSTSSTMPASTAHLSKTLTTQTKIYEKKYHFYM